MRDDYVTKADIIAWLFLSISLGIVVKGLVRDEDKKYQDNKVYIATGTSVAISTFIFMLLN
jgi:hypothetical protein